MVSIRVPEIYTMDNFDFGGKKVLVRVDFNSPVDPHTGTLINVDRIVEHSKTIKELVEKGAAVVVVSHQGRPGEKDFISLEQHAKVLSKNLGFEVKFIDDVFGPKAREEIKKLKPNEVLVLDNLRLCSEEVIERPPGLQTRTFLVRKLAPLFNIFVLDAFAAAHRSQPSLVGFPVVLPSCAGRVMEKEVKALQRIFSGEERPIIFILGGAKLSDSVRIIEFLLKNNAADKILVTGLLSLLLLYAKDEDIGRDNVRVLEDKGALSLVYKAKHILRKYGDKIELPIDYAVDVKGERTNKPLGEVNGRAKDIGENTIKKYSEILKEAKIVVLRGPAGVIEEPQFSIGSIELAKAAIEYGSFIVFGGGHMRIIAERINAMNNEKVHVSTGGGALLMFLSGEPLPALEALEISAKMFRGVKTV